MCRAPAVLCPAERDFHEWLVALPEPAWRERMDVPLRDLDERARIKQRKIDAAKRKKRREAYALKRAGVSGDMRLTLFGHLD